MSVEQTRGRLDCGTQGVAGDGQRRALPRHPHLRHHATPSKPKQIAAVQTCRGSHTHTLVTDPKDTREPLHLRLGHRHGALGRRARRLLRARTRRRIRTRRSSASTSSRCRSPRPRRRAIVNRPRIFADTATGAIAGLWQGGDHGPGTQKTSRDQSVPRHHRLPGDRPRRRRLLGQRHPARHLRSGPSGPARSRARQELRLLALGDVQQRRHQGDLHRRMGRRHAAALPRDRSADLGRRRHLRHRRSQAAVRAATTRCRRRRPSRRTASRTTAR